MENESSYPPPTEQRKNLLTRIEVAKQLLAELKKEKANQSIRTRNKFDLTSLRIFKLENRIQSLKRALNERDQDGWQS